MKSERRVGAGSLVPLLLPAVVLLCSACSCADPVSQAQAESAVMGWLGLDSAPLGMPLSREVRRIERYDDDQGGPAYYVLYVRPDGFVIVAGDDLVEPIIAFFSEGVYDPSPTNPLGALVTGDLGTRVAEARLLQQRQGQANQTSLSEARFVQAREKWARLISLGQASGQNEALAVGEPSDIWVAPLVQSKWDQQSVCSYACYNYYTPPYSSGYWLNDPCGCVATAMAQIMRHHQYPAAPNFSDCHLVWRCDSPYDYWCPIGGTGPGGAYQWTLMDLVPDCATPLSHRQEIGRICRDAGCSVEMRYCSGGSAAYTDRIGPALKNAFRYSNAVFGANYGYDIGPGLKAMMNPNLDGGLPVLLCIAGGSGGHAIVCDGYGYSASTLYHHLNMGWSGQVDGWYNLPTVIAGGSLYTSVTGCIYNIYPSGTGEIISGRVTTSGGSPLAGVNITAQRTGGGVYSATTNDRGVYALAKIPSSSTYTITPFKSGYTFSPSWRAVGTGLSSDKSSTSGNVCEVSFVTTACAAPAVITHPASQTACVGQNSTLTVLATGTPPLSYRWRKNGSSVSGATSSSYVILPVGPSDAGAYDCLVSNACGTVTSNLATVSVASPPTITGHAEDQVVGLGQTVTFWVTVTDVGPCAYRWQKDGTDIPGATLSVYSMVSASVGDSGGYRCVVSNSCGSATSDTILLIVDPDILAVSISLPVSGPTYTTHSAKVDLAGTAAAAAGVKTVTWSNDRGGSGACRLIKPSKGSKLYQWSASGVRLQPGDNLITVTAEDTAKKSGSAALKVVFTDNTPPLVSIKKPSAKAAFATTSPLITLSGTATDDVAISQVEWFNDRGGSGICTGTTSWKAAAVVLHLGANALVAAARDTSGNLGAAGIVVTYVDKRSPFWRSLTRPPGPPTPLATPRSPYAAAHRTISG